MRVLIVNTSEKTGGAAVAANRLMDALNNNGVKAKMLVRDKETEDITVVELPHRSTNKWHFLRERLGIYLRLLFQKEHLWEIDTASSGCDITQLREFKEADVIHLSWINQGMLSLKGIQKILKSGKPVVWTMHDLWMATGICHYTRGCHANRNGCGNCQLLPGGGSDNDLSASVYRKKQKLMRDGNIYFVSCSKWLENEARQSGLFVGQRLTNIPNPIDTHLYRQQDKKESRLRSNLPADKKLILFVSQKVTDARKGVDYFVEAIHQLVNQHPEMKETTGVVLLGGHSEEIAGQLSLPVFPQGYISDPQQIVNLYNSSDVFVLPSLEDNLPNTLMEAMACGVPCVGFRVGGIPEEIDHQKNGYVAQYRDAADLARGIRWVLCEADYDTLSRNAVTKVAHSYSQQSVALRYTELYNEAIAQKHYKL